MVVQRNPGILNLRARSLMGRYQLLSPTDHIPADAAGRPLVLYQRVFHMVDPHRIGYHRCSDLVVRLLHVRCLPGLDEATVAVKDLPPLLQNTIRRGIRRNQVPLALADLESEKQIADVIRELVIEEVH